MIACPFPRSKERGFIEAENCHEWAADYFPFRVQKNAASLKRDQLLGRYLDSLRFPRSKERGFIEATVAITHFLIHMFFPRSKERGFIEALFEIYNMMENVLKLSAFKRTRLH